MLIFSVVIFVFSALTFVVMFVTLKVTNITTKVNAENTPWTGDIAVISLSTGRQSENS